MCTLVSQLRNRCQIQSHEDFSPMFFSKSFIVLSLNFASLTHFELVFVYVIRCKGSAHMWGFVSGLSLPFYFMSVLMSVPHYFDHCSFVISFEIERRHFAFHLCVFKFIIFPPSAMFFFFCHLFVEEAVICYVKFTTFWV